MTKTPKTSPITSSPITSMPVMTVIEGGHQDNEVSFLKALQENNPTTPATDTQLQSVADAEKIPPAVQDTTALPAIILPNEPSKVVMIRLRDDSTLLVQGITNPMDLQFLKELQASENALKELGIPHTPAKIKKINPFADDNKEVVQSIQRIAQQLANAENGFPPCVMGNPAVSYFVAKTAYNYGFDPFMLAGLTYSVNKSSFGFYGTFYETLLSKFAPIVGGMLWFGVEGNFKDITLPAGVAGDPINSDYHAIHVYALATNGVLLKLRLSMAMAVRMNGSPLWRTNPQQQLKYTATRLFTKVFFPQLFNNLDTECDFIRVPNTVSYTQESLMAFGYDLEQVVGSDGELLMDEQANAIQQALCLKFETMIAGVQDWQEFKSVREQLTAKKPCMTPTTREHLARLLNHKKVVLQTTQSNLSPLTL